MIYTLTKGTWETIIEALGAYADEKANCNDFAEVADLRELQKALERIGKEDLFGQIEGYRLRKTSGKKCWLELRIIEREITDF